MREKAKISNLVSRSLDYISDHYREQIKVGDIAKRLHLSETHFRRVFTQYMGVSPLEYINMVRIRSACEYLIKTDDSIAAIAEKCGYYTSSTFNRNFHKTVGMTPEEWRKKPENFERKLLEFNVHSEEGWQHVCNKNNRTGDKKEEGGGRSFEGVDDRLWCVFCAFGDCFFQGIYAVGISVDLSLPGL